MRANFENRAQYQMEECSNAGKRKLNIAFQ